MEFIQTTEKDAEALSEIRAIAMKPSLVALGRFDENRVRNRFLETFDASNTFKIIVDNELLGFYVIIKEKDHYYLSHLYILPKSQNSGLGKNVITSIIELAKAEGLPIRLGALRGSRSNDFYLKNGFMKTHEDEFDIYYEYTTIN